MLSPTSEVERSVCERHAQIRAVQDFILDGGGGTADVAVYGSVAIHYSVHAQYPGPGYDAENLPAFDPAASTDPVTRAAVAELGAELVEQIALWLATQWQWFCTAAAALTAVAEVLPGYHGSSSEACKYRRAARDIAAEAGESCAGIVWAGAAAEARWLRLYGGRLLASLDELAVDPAVAAARLELTGADKCRITNWVCSPETWERIDARAEELLTKRSRGEAA